jgi:hypothetical protein
VLVAVAFNLPIHSPTRPSTAKPTLLGGPAKHVMLYGGARSGKTFVLYYAVLWRGQAAPNSTHIIYRHHFNHLRR